MPDPAPLQQAIHAATDPDWDDDAPPPSLHERVPWRIGVLDKDSLEDPDAIVDNALLIAGWYVYDCVSLLEQLQAAQAEVERLRKANDGLYRQTMAKELRALQEFVDQIDKALKSGWDHDRIVAIWEARAALDLAAQRKDPQ